MKIKHLLVFSLLSFFVSFGLNAFGDDGHTEEQNKAVKEFVVEGIGLGATYSEIKAKYPDIEFMKEDSDAKVGLAVWRTFSTKKVDAVRFYIFNGKTYKISIFYTAETLSKFGGYAWQFFDANRYINYNVVKENSCGFVIVVDKELSRQLSEKRKSQADVGF